MKFLVAVVLSLFSAVFADDQSYHRLSDPSTHLKVTSCRNINPDLFGDEPGTCESVGYTEACVSCRGAMTFMVEDISTCSQESTECYFRTEDEECIGTSQCPYGKEREGDRERAHKGLRGQVNCERLGPGSATMCVELPYCEWDDSNYPPKCHHI